MQRSSLNLTGIKIIPDGEPMMEKSEKSTVNYTKKKLRRM